MLLKCLYPILRVHGSRYNSKQAGSWNNVLGHFKQWLQASLSPLLPLAVTSDLLRNPTTNRSSHEHNMQVSDNQPSTSPPHVSPDNQQPITSPHVASPFLESGGQDRVHHQ